MHCGIPSMRESSTSAIALLYTMSWASQGPQLDSAEMHGVTHGILCPQCCLVGEWLSEALGADKA